MFMIMIGLHYCDRMNGFLCSNKISQRILTSEKDNLREKTESVVDPTNVAGDRSIMC
jgi:hypothetical protein